MIVNGDNFYINKSSSDANNANHAFMPSISIEKLGNFNKTIDTSQTVTIERL